jgi:hypothetical protein
MSRGSSFREDGQSRDPLTVNPLVESNAAPWMVLLQVAF